MVIDRLDLVTKRIYLAAGVREYHPVADVYREIRTLRRTNESYRGIDTPVVASGNVAKGGGKFTPRLATFRHGWKVVPEDTSHVLYISGEQITDEGEAGPMCIDFTPLSSSSKVIVHYEPPLAEIIETGISGLTEEESTRLQAIEAKTDNLPSDPATQSLIQEMSDVIGTPTSPTIANDLDIIEQKVDTAEDKLVALIEELKASVRPPRHLRL